MAIIVEDGTGVENANSYATLVELLAFAEARGVLSIADDAEISEPYLIKAMDYIEPLGVRFKGCKATAEQALQWPRIGVVLHGHDFAEDAIPRELKQAQMRLAMEIAAGVDVQPTTEGQAVLREKVGPLETEYATARGDGSPMLPAVWGFLAPLLRPSSGRVIRA